MDRQQARDEIARLRFEAKEFRTKAGRHRQFIRRDKERPIGQRDPIGRLHSQARIGEYTLAAQERDRLAKQIRRDYL